MNFFKRILSLIPLGLIGLGIYLIPSAWLLLPVFTGIGFLIRQFLRYDGIPFFGKYNNALKKVMTEIMATDGEFQSSTFGYNYREYWYWNSPKTDKKIVLEYIYKSDTGGSFYEFMVAGKTIKLSSFDKMVIRNFFKRGKEFSDKDKEIKVINETLSSMIYETYEKEQEELQKRWDKIEQFKSENLTKVENKKKLTS